MGNLIDDLLNLSRITRGTLQRTPFDLSLLADEVVQELRDREPARRADVSIQPGLKVEPDRPLLRAALQNLLANAWKFTRKRRVARIELLSLDHHDEQCNAVRDNGVGFDLQYADQLFAPFQRLHSSADYEGTGIGLATVQRIIARHGGRVWATANPGEGATFYFTLNSRSRATEATHGK
jgi:light-regulated signal transduction histidine kinase (bacteriophytochrome)